MTEQAAEEPFHDTDRQEQADRLGMLVFLASEIMLFGGIFAATMALRIQHPQDYMKAASHLRLALGTANTAILLTSSLAAALAVEGARSGRSRWAARALAAACLLGTAFLAVKGYEYAGEYREGLMPGTAAAHFSGPLQRLFMDLYFLATGLHAFHVLTGIVLMLTAALNRTALHDRRAVLIGNVALYWHLVDIVWIFLFPTLYLAGVP
ncbi:MAG: cytochrome c oxidase subunit 3 [Novosphingobium sp.]|nr:cytochrome c oxidase subunit 3 [Novosphingobium sp.]